MTTGWRPRLYFGLHSPLTVGIYLLYLVSLFLHGLVIWLNPVQRVVTLSIGVVILSMTIVQMRRRILTPHGVVTSNNLGPRAHSP